MKMNCYLENYIECVEFSHLHVPYTPIKLIEATKNAYYLVHRKAYA